MATGNTGVRVKVVDKKIEGRHPAPNGSESIGKYSKTAPKFPSNVSEGNPKPNNRDTIKPYNTKA